MKNNMKKIICSVLTAVTAFTVVAGVLPVRAAAAHSSVCDTATVYSVEDVKEIVRVAQLYGSASPVDMTIGGKKTSENVCFATVEECLDYELGKGYLDSVKKDFNGVTYVIYANRYTGVIYYKNEATGQILSSNPIDPVLAQGGKTAEILSQLTVEFFSNEQTYSYNSTEWAANYAQISTGVIENGIRVNYTLGDTTARFFLPGRVSVELFEGSFLKPMVEKYEELITSAEAGLGNKAWKFFGNTEKYTNYLDGTIYTTKNVATRYYGDDKNGTEIKPGLKKYLADMATAEAGIRNYALKNQLSSIRIDINSLLAAYNVVNVAAYENQPNQQDQYNSIIENFYSDPSLAISETLEPFYRYNGHDSSISVANDRQKSQILLRYNTANESNDNKGFTYAMMYSEERRFGYKSDSLEKPVIRCALEYTFADDGSLAVRLPANSISFDESTYTIVSITPLQYFGAGDIKDEGYIFFPDGSGTIIDFEDFRNGGSIIGSGTVYGIDYCYSTITGAHHEQISMPVYGVVGMMNTNQTTKDNLSIESDKIRCGYFAILEEGASLASLSYLTGGTSHHYASAYAFFNPYPSDTCELSVGGGTYTVVSDSKYNGSYVTRYTMLSEPAVGIASGKAYYDANYAGMAAYYRDYLKKSGVLTALTETEADLPLYVESLGSMKIQKKVLSFPVEVSVPLTSFEDVQQMYSELVEAGVKNVNFRLTGFANGGMYYTYPARLKWERAVGGKRGFKDLVSAAATESAKAGYHFGVYPEFDFAYISNQKGFDGVVRKGTASRMVDNRYASKKVYNAVSGKFVRTLLKGADATTTLVVSPDIMDSYFTKFVKKYGKYDLKTLSLSTLGSDLNSNFDPKQAVNRNDALGYVSALLSRITKDEGYSLMLDKGNIYAVSYAEHLLNVATDSSHFRYSSYAIPFVGMILHGSVNYAGSAINSAGAQDYELLRAIESGASLYYILCMENTEEMKNDPVLNTYYGVDYETWKPSLVATYNELNGLLKDYQTYTITDHRVILGERVIEETEQARDYNTLKAEFLTMVRDQIYAKVNEAIVALRKDPTKSSVTVGVSIDQAAQNALVDRFAELLGIEGEEKNAILDQQFVDALAAVVKDFTDEYTGSETVTFDAQTDFVYDSAYSYLTLSEATAEDYVITDYTSDLNNIVLVTYAKGDDQVRFILNYNIYTVDVRIDGKVYTVQKFGYAKVDN